MSVCKLYQNKSNLFKFPLLLSVLPLIENLNGGNRKLLSCFHNLLLIPLRTKIKRVELKFELSEGNLCNHFQPFYNSPNQTLNQQLKFKKIMRKFKFPLIAAFFAGLFTLALLSCKKEKSDPSLTSDAAKKTRMDAPVLACGIATTASIEIKVTAGASGAPAGFSVQWITAAALASGPDGVAGTSDDNTWPSSDAIGLCKASFSGNASGFYYSLAAGQTATVRIGDILYDNPGASTNCSDALVCGTAYVFRAFAHANSALTRSDFTANLNCSTASCPTDACSLSQGYWFNNASVHAWPGSISFGSCTYDEASGRALKVLYKAGGVVMQSFLQASAIKLSYYGNEAAIPAVVKADLDILEAFLGTLPCLSTGSPLPSATSPEATAAAARISTWIDAHH